MTRRDPRPAFFLAAFCLTLSLLALRDRLDGPRRVEVEAGPPVVLVAGR